MANPGHPVIRLATISFLCLTILSCTKETVQPNRVTLEMEGRTYRFTPTRSVSEHSCGVVIHEVSGYAGARFFKINWTSAAALQPALFEMGNNPGNNIAGTATLWTTLDGVSYTATPFRLTVAAYNHHQLIAYFNGGRITNGKIQTLLK